MTIHKRGVILKRVFAVTGANRSEMLQDVADAGLKVCMFDAAAEARRWMDPSEVCKQHLEVTHTKHVLC